MEYTEYAPGRFGCPDCGVEKPKDGSSDHESWCRNPEAPQNLGLTEAEILAK